MTKKIANDLKNIGLKYSEEVTNSLKNYSYSTDYDPRDDFLDQKYKRKRFINILQNLGFIPFDLSSNLVVEIGGGICSTGAAFSDKCKLTIAFELGKVHCYYTKLCKEYFNINNLAVFHGSISKIEGSDYYTVYTNSVDIVVSHLGMFRDTIVPSLNKLYEMLKSDGVFILVFPRFWTDCSQLNFTDKKLLDRAFKNDDSWFDFKNILKYNLSNLGFKIIFEGMMDDYSQLPMGGDIIVGSNIATTKDEYYRKPIPNLVFGKTNITCNTLICKK